MRLGLIARADTRGLGIQTKAFFDQLHPHKTLVVDCPSAMPLRLRPDWYPGAQWTQGLPTAADIEAFLDGVDVVLTAETGYTPLLWDIAERRGVKTVLQANFEFLNREDRPTQWVAPSLWRINDWPHGTVHVPVPIETEHFADFELPELPTRLLHVVGRPTFDRNVNLHRNGTIDVLKALEVVTAPLEVTITCQQDGYVQKLCSESHLRMPDNVTLTISDGDTANYWDLYRDQHALLLPRRWGGLCLSANEAIGAGMPVIMTDIDPNNTWLPANWLVPAYPAGGFRAKQHVTMHRPNIAVLAAKIQQLATDAEFYARAKTLAARLRRQLSWDTLRPRYEELLSS